MKTRLYLTIFLSVLLASCSSLQNSVNDDLYYTPGDEQLASNDVFETPSYDKTDESTIFSKKYDQEISEILEDTTKETIDTTIYKNEESENPYDRLIVDSYGESMERRMNARMSPYYGLNNYYITLSDDFWYAQSFFNDPYYNVIIIGDQVWVEPYWMSSWYFRPYYGYGYGYPYYYNYGYPYYSYYGYYGYSHGFYSSWYYNPYYYNSYPYYNHNNTYASSSFHSYRQRSVAGMSGTRSTIAKSRELPESYMGRDIRRSSTVKSGIDRQSATSVRSRDVSSASRTRTSINSSETIRVRESTSNRSGSSVRTSSQSGSTRSYTRPNQTSRSTYSTSRSATRYNRPESTNVRSGRSSSGVSRSGYTPRGSSSGSRSGSTYTPSRSSKSSGSSVNRSSSRSSGSSYRSSGSSSRSSGSSSSSSSSSRSSSSSSGRSGGRR